MKLWGWGGSKAAKVIGSTVKNDGYIGASVDSSTSFHSDEPQIEDHPLSYQAAKLIYVNNPMAAKIVNKPIEAAMSVRPIIKIEGCPDQIIEAIWDEYDALNIDEAISAYLRDKRIYGAAAIIMGIEGLEPEDPYRPDLARMVDIWFNHVDPLQMAGESVCQDVNSKDYGRIRDVSISGRRYARGRFLAGMNGSTIYIKFEPSTFKFAGRSVFRNIQKPLSSYMESFDMVGRVCALTGVLVHKTQGGGGGGIGLGLDAITRALNIFKIKALQALSVIGIGANDTLENLQFQHVDEAMKARQAIIEDCASGSGVPQKLLLEDSFASLLSSGSEDYKAVVGWVRGFQKKEVEPALKWVVPILLRRVLTPRVFEAIQATAPEMSDMHMATATSMWVKNIKFEWPVMIAQSEEEKRKALVDQHKVVLDTYAITKDGAWLADELNGMEGLFKNEVVAPDEFDSVMVGDLINGNSNELSETV